MFKSILLITLFASTSFASPYANEFMHSYKLEAYNRLMKSDLKCERKNLSEWAQLLVESGNQVELDTSLQRKPNLGEEFMQLINLAPKGKVVMPPLLIVRQLKDVNAPVRLKNLKRIFQMDLSADQKQITALRVAVVVVDTKGRRGLWMEEYCK